MIKNLFDNGFLNQIFISADFGRTSYYKAYGGGPGLDFIVEQFYPRLMTQLSLSESELYQLQVLNPQCLYGQF